MANVDEELTIRRMLTDLTADQPPAPPSRYAAVRRRATVHRRRQIAGAAAAVAILAFAAIAIPLGLVHIGLTPPSGPSRHYHVSQQRPGPDATGGLVATGTAAGQRWKLSVQETKGDICEVEQFPPGSVTSSNCAAGGAPTAASRSGDPVSLAGADGSPWQLYYGTVRSDVSYLTVSYNNGQVIPVYPVAVFSAGHARYFAFATPYSAAITKITAISRSGSGSDVLAYAIPFTGGGSLEIVRWLQPGQPAVPGPARAMVGSGRVHSQIWHGFVNLGPWGTCFTGVGNAVTCSPRIAWPQHQTSSVDQLSSSGSGFGYGVVFGETSPAVSYLILTTTTGLTAKVSVVSVAGRKFFAYASATRDPVVRWSAYNADGQQVGSGRPMQ